TATAAFDSPVPADTRLGLLCGDTARPCDSGGRTVCTCFGVGLETLQAAIVERRLASIAEIGAALRAGTNCGSCIPEISAILRQGDARG
ncbi:MAG: (2Fe-2S)-binding protein, partial [Alphaproteobacteria bacterium]|nr:(2Fe-2S)-binding protein [Alphaproteobacteria bacterium]